MTRSWVLLLLLPAPALAQTELPPEEPEIAGLEHLERVGDVAWAPEIERRCERRSGIRYASCDGPRRVVLPSEEASERAERLGLGTHAAADVLWTGAPPAEWIAEAGARHEGMLWPVAAGLFSRGFGA